MQLVTDQVKKHLTDASWIRKMFERGIEMKKEFGAENVYDFSLGNPDLPPPQTVGKALKTIADKTDTPLALGYMPNAGYPETRNAIADYLTTDQGVIVPMNNIIVTCGAAGAINIFFRTVLEPGDEVICPAPYFVEYDFYVGNFGGKLCPVKTNPPDFSFDLDAFDRAFSPATRAVIINSPNNPTGRIYRRDELEALVAVVRRHADKNRRPIFLLSDEPYRFLNFDKVELPSVFELYEHSVVAGSFSKSLSLAGARIGYLAVNPAIQEADELINGVIMSNRVLGFVNAGAIAQKILTTCINESVDITVYRERRDAMAAILDKAGIEYTMPGGAFYFFPKSPVPDENLFMDALIQERILAVPGSGFGYPGYFRLTFCVDADVIRHSAAGFVRATSKLR